VSNRLINWTRNGRTVRRNITIGVAYGTDPAAVETLLLDIAKRAPKILAWPQPHVTFTDFGSSTLDFMVCFWADISDAGRIASEMRKDIARTFAEQGISIAFPQLDVHIVRDNVKIPAASDAPI
ncbi:MAG: mechanosensitive ion channel, partial [Deltaproteobacteria bacterium]|jgi:small-conductance mechanosensitive channel|nr:mechanosensitive ion channel [Deltaproteobacteria bacterium]